MNKRHSYQESTLSCSLFESVLNHPGDDVRGLYHANIHGKQSLESV